MTLEAFYKLHPRVTRSFKKYVNDYQSQLDEETFVQFLEMLHETLLEQSQSFESLPTNELKARHLHTLTDVEISKAEIPSSCFKGCSACCHMEVEITNYEADILADVVKNGFSIDYERLSQQSQRALQDETWRQGICNQESRCVFLNAEGACGVYEHRPVMCRRHSVTSPAKNCETPDAPITLRYFPKIDLYISAANEDENLEVGPLAKMLQMRLAE